MSDFDGSQPDVDPTTGDERRTDPNPLPWVEADDEYEGVGAHPSNPRYDHTTALADHHKATNAEA